MTVDLPIWIFLIVVLFPTAMTFGLSSELRKSVRRRHDERDRLCARISELEDDNADLRGDLIDTRAELGLATGKYPKPVGEYLIDEDG